MSVIKKEVPKDFEGRKIREFLKEDLGLSSRLIRGASIDKRIFVDNKAVKMNYVLRGNEQVLIKLDKEESQNIAPEKMDIEVVYEDEEIIVDTDKRPNMVVHPTKRHQSGTLANGLIYYFQQTNQSA